MGGIPGFSVDEHRTREEDTKIAVLKAFETLALHKQVES